MRPARITALGGFSSPVASTALDVPRIARLFHLVVVALMLRNPQAT